MTEAATPTAEVSAPTDNQATPTEAPTETIETPSDDGSSFLAKGTQEDWTTQVPDKFKAENGINHEAIFKGYKELEGRLGKFGLPPESPDKYEYQYQPPEDGALVLNNEVFDNLKSMAHSLGLSQKQFEPIAKGFDEFSKSVIEEAIKTAGIDSESQFKKTEEALTEVWKTPEAIKENIGLAQKAFMHYASDMGISVDEIGNNPAAIRILAKIGAKMGEDKGGLGSPPVSKTISELTSHPAYLNPHHPQHKEVVDAANRAFGVKI